MSPRHEAIRHTIESYRKSIKRLYPDATFDTEFVLGTTVSEFIEYIESKMQPGMTWENKKQKWQLIKIHKSMDSERGFYDYFNYKNFMPAWKMSRGFVADPTKISPLDRDADTV